MPQKIIENINDGEKYIEMRTFSIDLIAAKYEIINDKETLLNYV